MTHPDAPSVAATPIYSPLSDRDGEASTPADVHEWNVAQRIGFRFLLVYILLYTYPGPIDELPFTGFLSTPLNAFWHKVVPWVGKSVLHLAQPVSLQPSGSGDRMFNWVQAFAMLALAAIAAIIWTAIDRRPRSHRKLLAALKVYLRFTLASTMFGYGFDKIIPNQFEPMNPVRLTQYIGEAAPGGFAWSFLGFSVMYEIFAGAGETIAGLLLLLRRTTTLGAIIGAAVLTNVFMLNMSYDIPVKQYSGHLLLFCAVLVAFDAERLLNVLVRGRGAEPPRETELFTTPRARLVARVGGIAFGLWMIFGHIRNEMKGLRQYGRLAPRGPIYGIFEVENVIKNGAVQPALLTDATRWRRLASWNRGTSIRFATDSAVRVRLQTDSIKHVATFTFPPDTMNKAALAYTFPDSMHLVLRGRIGADSIEMTLRRRPEDSFLLIKRGFHLVNEVPYFR
jgi:uncharacterized membrane protein YphA (DoxX/SURF4 family)